ncbi:GGDEF domain-containing protein [Ideonella margarita]|uniref:diguanylate cyclase n=1 Tax=Ideonella margarita TaxID=2984191 RepID=A0ABU9C599_9BURK
MASSAVSGAAPAAAPSLARAQAPASAVVAVAADEVDTIERRARANPMEVAAALPQRLQSGAPLTDSQRVALLRLLGELQIKLEQPANATMSALATLEAGREVPTAVRADAQASRACVQADQLRASTNQTQALRLQDEALEAVARGQLLQVRLYCLAVFGGINDSLGRFGESVRLYQLALGAADREPTQWRRTPLRSSLAYALARAGEVERATQLIDEALSIGQAAQDWLSLSQVQAVRSILLTDSPSPGLGDGIAGAGAVRSAELAALESALNHAQQAGAAREEALGLANLADYYLRRADYARAKALLEQALPLARAQRYATAERLARQNLGLALIASRQKDKGLPLVQAELDRMHAADEIVDESDALRELGKYLELGGYTADALAVYRKERDLSYEAYRRDQQRVLLELQASFEADKRRHEKAVLLDENQLKAETLRQRDLQLREWALAGGVLLFSFGWLSLGYRRMRRTQRALHHNNQRLLEQSERDPLTGLGNRRHFQRLTHDGDQALPVSGSLFLIDIDHFKRINDLHGHAAGDAVLADVARRLRAVLREEDHVLRWGGEEFLVVTGPRRREQTEALAQRLLGAIGAVPMRHEGHSMNVTASIGFADFPLPPDAPTLTWEQAVNLVDAAMFLAKAQGRNRAFGIRHLPVSDMFALDNAMSDLAAAWQNGEVTLTPLYGPVQEVAT